jgi:hypothetical protein
MRGIGLRSRRSSDACTSDRLPLSALHRSGRRGTLSLSLGPNGMIDRRELRPTREIAMQGSDVPAVEVEMGIRRPPPVVFRAFVDPAVTTRFWLSKSSGVLTEGETQAVARIADSTGGFTMVLCAAKALLEHDIELRAVQDRNPDNVEL